MIKKVEYLFPLGILIRAMIDIPDLDLYKLLEFQ